MRWEATESKCADGTVWIARDTQTSWQYVLFETEEQARRYALALNAEVPGTPHWDDEAAEEESAAA